MNPVVRHFLPSVVRGVYRFDTGFASVESEQDLQRFTAQKLRFLPCALASELRRRVPLTSDLSTTRRQLVFPDNNLGGPVAIKSRYRQFFAQHPYFANALGNQEDDEAADNFLEIEFVKRVLAPLLKPQGLHALRPQHEVGQYSVDFALRGVTKFAFEVDGFGKFQTRPDLDAFVHRQNYLTGNGWRVIRYTHSQIMEGTSATMR